MFNICANCSWLQGIQRPTPIVLMANECIHWFLPQVVLGYVLQSVSSHVAHMLINIHHMVLGCLQSLLSVSIGTYTPWQYHHIRLHTAGLIECMFSCAGGQDAPQRSLLGIQAPPLARRPPAAAYANATESAGSADAQQFINDVFAGRVWTENSCSTNERQLLQYQ